MKKLSKAQAWRLIARNIDAGKWEHLGLCRELFNLADKGKVEWWVMDAMGIDIRTHINIRDVLTGVYNEWAFPPGGGPVRVLAALFLALEAEDEK